MRLLHILLLAAAASLPLNAQQTKILSADKHNEYGLEYSLPNTVFDIDVTARHTLRTAGPFWEYAKKYAGTDNVVRENAEEWVITDVRITPRGVADPSQRYLMQLKPGALTYIGVGADGMILSINAEPASSPAPAAYRPSAPLSPRPADAYLAYVNEDFLSSPSSAKKAQLLYQSIMEVRDARLSLTRGTAETMPTDGRQLELMLTSLGAQEEALTRAFTGSVDSETVTRRFTYTPAEGSSILFRMSDFAGFTDADDLSGDPVRVSLEVISEASLPKDDKGVEKKLPKDAVVYAIPAGCRIEISMPGRTLLTQDVEVAQLGTVFGLAPSLFSDRKSPSFARFNPATGAITEIGEVKNNPAE